MVHDTLVTAPQHPYDRTKTPLWPHQNTLADLSQGSPQALTRSTFGRSQGEKLPPQEGFPTRGFEPVTPFFCNETSHLATKLLPKRVGMLKFRTTNKCAKYRKKHRKRGQTCLLRPSRGRKITHFVPFSRQLSRVQKDSKCCILLIYSLLDKNTNGRLFQFQLFQLKFWGCPFPYIYM